MKYTVGLNVTRYGEAGELGESHSLTDTVDTQNWGTAAMTAIAKVAAQFGFGLTRLPVGPQLVKDEGEDK